MFPKCQSGPQNGHKNAGRGSTEGNSLTLIHTHSQELVWNSSSAFSEQQPLGVFGIHVQCPHFWSPVWGTTESVPKHRVLLPWGHQLGTTALGFVPKTGLLVKGGVPGPHCTEGLCASPSFQCLCGIKIPRGCEEVVKNNNQNPKPEEIWCWMKGMCLSTCVGSWQRGCSATRGCPKAGCALSP